MPTLFLDRRRGELLTSLASGRRKTTLAELWRAHEASSATVNLYVVDSDDNGRLAPVDLSASDDKPLFRMAADKLDLRAGYLTLTFGGDTTTAIELDRITAHQIETRLNQAEAVITAGRVDVEESPGDGTARAFRIRFRAVGSRATMTAAITGDQPPVGPTITTIEEGDADDRETVLLVLAPRKIISLETVAWTALTAPTVAISTLATGSASVSSSFRITVGTASSAIPRTYHFRIVVGGATTGLIKTDASALEVEGAIADALGTTGTWRARKVAAHSWEITKAALGVATMTLTDTLATGWAGLTGTLTADSGAVLSLVAGSRKTECRATIESGAGEMLYRETLPLVSAIEGLGSTSPLVTARTVVSASDPTVNDDSGDGYGLFTLWVNTTDDGAFILADNTAGAAVWTEIGGSGSAASILASLLTVDGAGSGLDADLLDGYSSAAFLRAANNLSDVADADTALYNIGGMTEIERWAVGDGTSTPVSEWLTGGLRDRGYANLAAIQAVYPHVGATTDQIDWAVIQGELNAISAETRDDRRVLIPDGIYMIQTALTIKGSGVTLEGMGGRKTALKATATGQDGINFSLDAGGEFPVGCAVRNLAIVGVGHATATGYGIVAGKSDKSEDVFMGALTVDRVFSQGWDVGIWAASVANLALSNVFSVGNNSSYEFAKCDTWTALSCWGGNNYGWDEVTTTATGATTFILRAGTGDIPGPNFAGTIIGGEFGNASIHMDISGACRVTEIGANHEVYSNSAHKIRLTNGTYQGIGNRWGSWAGSGATEPVILVQPEVTAGCYVSLDNDLFSGHTGYGIKVDAAATERLNAFIMAPQHKIGYYEGVTFISETKGSGSWIRVMDGYTYDSIVPDTNLANAAAVRGQLLALQRYAASTKPDDLVMNYQRGDGTAFRSSVINDQLVRKLGASRAQSMSGTDQEPLRVTVPANACWKTGQALVFEAFGTAASSGIDDELNLWLSTEFYSSGLIDIDGFFKIAMRAEYVSGGSTADITVDVTWKGGVAREVKSYQSHSFPWTAGAEFLFQTTGTMTVHAAKLEMRGAGNH